MVVEGKVESSPFTRPCALLEGTAAGQLPRGVVWGAWRPGAQHLPPSSHLPFQVVYYSEMHKIFGDLTQQLDQPGHTDEQRERENEARLSELRALSIVADD